MRTIHPTAFQSTQHLPNHHRLLKASLEYFQKVPEIDGVFLRGGLAAGKVGPFGSLDLGLFCEQADLREKVLSSHPEWKIAQGLKLLKSHSKKPFTVTFVSDPSIHLEFRIFTLDDLPSHAEGPYILAWDSSGQLDLWLKEHQLIRAQQIDWSTVVHEDEQFWVWTHFSATHAARGEFHEVVHHLEDLREIVQSWQERLDAMAKANAKKIGNRFRQEFYDRLTKTFCPPHAESIKEAYKNLIKIQLQQRALIARTVAPQWKVSPHTINKIQIYTLNLGA